jgi:hypothetical protein
MPDANFEHQIVDHKEGSQYRVTGEYLDLPEAYTLFLLYLPPTMYSADAQYLADPRSDVMPPQRRIPTRAKLARTHQTRSLSQNPTLMLSRSSLPARFDCSQFSYRGDLTSPCLTLYLNRAFSL